MKKIRRGESLDQKTAAQVARTIFENDLEDQVIADLLVALAEKGETAEEIAGFTTELIHRALLVQAPADTIDLCGTGGGDLARFNVSTAAAFVAAACGLVVAKHGNRGSRRPNGAFDLLEALGFPIEIPSAMVAECLQSVGLAFIYARSHHPGMKRIAAARKLAARRTIFNLAAPLSNPARVTRQLVGTADPSKARILAEVLRLLGRERAIVVCGAPGIDEFSISGPSLAFDVTPDGITEFEVRPTDSGIRQIDYAEIPCGDSGENAEVFRALLENAAPQGIRDMVALNAGAGLYLSGRASTIKDGYETACDAIRNGRMQAKYDELQTFMATGQRQNSGA